MSRNELLAQQILKAWYDSAKNYASNFSMPFDSFLEIIRKQSPSFLGDFGKSVDLASNNIAINDIEKAMRNLAVNTQGLVPTYPDGAIRLSYFYDALIKEARPSYTNLSFVKKAVPEVAAETATAAKNLAIAGVSLYVLAGLGVAAVALYMSMRRAA